MKWKNITTSQKYLQMKLKQHKRKKKMILQRYKEENKIIEEYKILLKQETKS